MAERTRIRHQRRSGHAVIEIALLGPWIFFLFIGVLDFGFFAYAAIATENAARVAALFTSSGRSVAGVGDNYPVGDDAQGAAEACKYALGELRALPNVWNGGTPITTCGNISDTQPVNVTVTALNPGVDGGLATRVEVTYQSIPMIPIPGLMMQRYTLTRAVEMRVRED